MDDRGRCDIIAPDFKYLAEKYSWFAKYVILYGNGKARIDWKNRTAVKEVTRVLLLHNFGLVWDMPLDHLCPPVPNRFNYIHWIEELLALQPKTPAATTTSWKNEGRRVVGIDIGTGASCIYPLLGVASHDNWCAHA